MPSAEIIAIGTELLLGEIPDTNTQVIARFLRSIGVDLYRTSAIGDNQLRVSTLIVEALKRCDLIITTGGLGPTVDDPTRDAVADAFHSPLVFHPELWALIRDRFKKYGRTTGENQKKQACIPEGARILENPVGSAPGFIVSNGNNIVISLPGVPVEMETMLNGPVKSFLVDHFDLHDVIQVRVLHCAGASEGWIDEKIGDLETLSNPTVGLAAHVGIIDVRITSKASSQAEADDVLNNLEQEIRNRLGNVIFGTDQQTLEKVVAKNLKEFGWTLSLILQGIHFDSQSDLNHLLGSSFFQEYKSIGEDQDIENNIQEIRAHSPTTVVMAISIKENNDHYDISITLDTPLKKFSRQVVYMGHPGILGIYGINIAFNHLRKIVSDLLIQ